MYIPSLPFSFSNVRTKNEFVFRFSYFTFENEKGIRFLFFVRKFENEKGISFLFFFRKFENEKRKDGIYLIPLVLALYVRNRLPVGCSLRKPPS